MPKEKDKKVQYEYKIINCHEIRDNTGIAHKEELLHYILNTDTIIDDGWRFHSLVVSEAFGVKDECPLVILERIRA